MKVKIGNEWVNSDDQPLAVQFTVNELEYIKKEMPVTEGNRKFGVATQERADGATLKAWIRDEVEL